MSKQFKQKKQHLGIIYGLMGGVAFAMAAWGIDSIALASANISYPFMKFIPGLLICALVGCLIGWITIRLDSHLVAIGLWFLFAVLLTWLVIWLPFSGTPAMIKFFQPNLTSWIDYRQVDHLQQFKILGMIIIALPSIICGLLEINIIEQSLSSSNNGGIFTLILVCGFLLGVAGLGADNLINTIFREPIQVLDDSFQFAIDNEGKEVDKVIARRMYLSTVEDLGGLLQKPRRMTVIAYDGTLAQVDILVNFDGAWVKCTTIYSHPIRCELILLPAYKILKTAIDLNF